jgi:4-carboxymuconolactone decarboxylase
MARTPKLDLARLSTEQRRVHDAIVAGPRGRVAGPLAVWLQSPGLADTAQALGAFCRYGSSLPPRLSELAIVVTGAWWRAGYEWCSHAPLALEAGIDSASLEAIRTGQTPTFEKLDEQAVYELVRELTKTQNVSDATYARAVEQLGLTSVVELVGIVGYYTLISMTIKTFEVAVPDGVTDPFETSM